ncbi:hypothetical protein M2169_006277 [Streptomyces sp. MJP52]|nr:hypothetical protein [Streptomyces sp. MJP52]
MAGEPRAEAVFEPAAHDPVPHQTTFALPTASRSRSPVACLFRQELLVGVETGSALKSWITSRTRSALVNVTSAFFATGTPREDSGTTCARRQVTTGPLPIRMFRSRRCPFIVIVLADAHTFTNSTAFRLRGLKRRQSSASAASTAVSVTVPSSATDQPGLWHTSQRWSSGSAK